MKIIKKYYNFILVIVNFLLKIFAKNLLIYLNIFYKKIFGKINYNFFYCKLFSSSNKAFYSIYHFCIKILHKI